jgi:hypothetical protein
MKVLEFIFIDFWHWLGAMLILYVTLNYVVNLLNNFMRYRILRKHGYPPCDVDEDLGPIKTEEVEKIIE